MSELTGVAAVSGKLAALAAQGRRTIADGLEDYPRRTIIPHAQLRAPVDTAEMQASGETLPVVWKGDRAECTFGFGLTGPSGAYAAIVHEDLEARHPKGGEAKFLESAINEDAPGLMPHMARVMTGDLR